MENNLILEFSNDNEYTTYCSKHLKDIVDVVALLKNISTQNTLNLIQILKISYEDLDKQNKTVDIVKVKKMLGIVGNYVVFNETNGKVDSIDKLLSNIKTYNNSILQLSNLQIDILSKEIFDNISKSITTKFTR